MARTRIRNISQTTALLPMPYSGVLPPSGSGIVSDDLATASGYLGAAVGLIFEVSVVPDSNPVTITTGGQVLAVDLAAGAVSDTTKIADGAVATADLAAKAVTQTTIGDAAVGTGQIADSAVTLAKIASGGIVTVQLFVDGNRTDTYTADGSILRPYKTITAALAAITDASTSKRYKVLLAVATYTEATLALKPFVWLVGQSAKGRDHSVQVVVSGGNVTAHSSWATGDHSAGMSGILLSSTGINFDLATLSATGENNLYLDDLQVNAATTIKLATSNDTAEMRNVVMFGDCSLINGNYTVAGCFIYANLTTDALVGVSNFPEFYSSYISGNFSVNSDVGGAATNQTVVFTTRIDGTVTVHGSSASYFQADAVSFPPASRLTLTVGQVGRYSDTLGMLYTPGTSGSWGTAPTTLQSAVDRIAALVKTLNGGTPIP